jgi:hypothetical protein
MTGAGPLIKMLTGTPALVARSKVAMLPIISKMPVTRIVMFADIPEMLRTILRIYGLVTLKATIMNVPLVVRKEM